jgi:hypothetical protein
MDGMDAISSPQSAIKHEGREAKKPESIGRGQLFNDPKLSLINQAVSLRRQVQMQGIQGRANRSTRRSVPSGPGIGGISYRVPSAFCGIRESSRVGLGELRLEVLQARYTTFWFPMHAHIEYTIAEVIEGTELFMHRGTQSLRFQVQGDLRLLLTFTYHGCPRSMSCISGAEVIPPKRDGAQNEIPQDDNVDR